MAFSYFFRDIDVLTNAVDKLIENLPAEGPISIWDAGCAYGQEPFSLAILMAERMDEASFQRVRILATDIDISDRFSQFIGSGVFPTAELQRIPSELFRRYFLPTDNENACKLKCDIRNSVNYKRDDLLKLTPPAGKFHLIVCKNVLMHFQPTERNAVFAMFTESLHDSGLLAMGQAQDYEGVDLAAVQRISPLLFLKRERVD